MHLHFAITFPKGYIAHPYWPAMARLIDIQKQSGVNRVRSDEKRVKTLRDFLTAHDMTQEDYEKLEADAAKPFYTAENLDEPNGHAPNEIVIPAHQQYGALAQGCALASSSIRIAKLEQLRTVIQVDDIFTGKTKADGTFDRFVVVKAGAGNKLSNQRALRSNPYLGKFTTDWTVRFSEEILPPKKVTDFLTFVGREIGVGASRKLGWGRFTIEDKH